MSPLGIFQRHQKAPVVSSKESSDLRMVKTTNGLALASHQGMIVTVPTPSDLTETSHLKIVRVSSCLSFSDDEDDDDWKRELAMATSAHQPRSEKHPVLSPPPPPPPPPLSSLRELHPSDSHSTDSSVPQVPLKRASSSAALDSLKLRSPSIEVARRRTFTETYELPVSPTRPIKPSHRRYRSFTEQDMQEVGDLQDSADFQAARVPVPRPENGLIGDSAPSAQGASPPSRGRLLSLANGSTLVHDLVSLTRILDQRRKKYGIFHVKVGLVWNQIGNYHFRCHEYEKALVAYREALECRDDKSEVIGQEHIASAYANIGTVLWSTGRAEQAITPLRKAERMRIAFEVSQGRDPERCLAIADSQHQLGLALCLNQQFDDALDALQRALLIRQRMAGEKSVAAALSLDAIGKIHFLRGDFAEAMTFHKRALLLKRSESMQGSPTVLASMKNVAAVQEACGDYDGAVASLLEVVEEQKLHLSKLMRHLRVGGRQHQTFRLAREVGDTLQQIARVHFARNNFIPNRAVEDAVREAISYYREGGVADNDPTMIALRTFIT